MSLPRYTMTNPTPALTDEVLLEQIDRGSRVIDLGCGDGRLLEQLRTQQDCDVLGVELEIPVPGLPALRRADDLL